MHAPNQQSSSGPTWEEVREELRKTVTASKPLGFQMWFGDVTGRVEEGADGLPLFLSTPSKVHTNSLKNDFLEAIHQAWHHFVPDGKVVFTEQPKPKVEQARVMPEPEQGQVILPAWADTRRAAASAVFRSALFPALARGHRQYCKNQKIFSTRGVDILFTGEQFDQSDLDVYLEILHFLKEQTAGTDCTFTAYGLLKAIGRGTGYTDYLWLHSVIARLTACFVDMTDGRKRYFGSLLDGGSKDELTKYYTIRINPEFAALLKHSWSSLDREQRMQLRGNPTAQSLHAYYSSHATPSAHEFATLAGIAGVNNRNKRDVKARIITAHEQMKATGFLESYEVSGNTIQAQINYTPSQNRHLARKIVKERKRRRK